MYLLTKKMLRLRFKRRAYFTLIREAVPQYVSVIFDMSLSRMDWILLGLMSTSGALANYSFAYRAFEIARLPVSIIALMILPGFARMLSGSRIPTELQRNQISSFNRTEATVATAIVLVLNILWTPVVGLITAGKYGQSNAAELLLLSLCIPILFYTNLLWSVCFGARKYKQLSVITIICAVVNIVLNLALIPIYNGLGSAAAFLITCCLQAALYYRLSARQLFAVALWPPFVFLAYGMAIYFGVRQLQVHYLLQLLIGLTAFFVVAIAFDCLSRQHIRQSKKLLAG
jgi:O-antigen/teichoic acid export membrane protein